MLDLEQEWMLKILSSERSEAFLPGAYTVAPLSTLFHRVIGEIFPLLLPSS